MEFLEQLLNVELGLPARFIIAFVTVLVLIGLTAWIVRRVAAGRGGVGGTRARQQRLAVVDATQVDAKRRLVLVRRDAVEHLILIGGPSDVVVEAQIGRAAVTAERGEPRPAAAPERLAPRVEPVPPPREAAPIPPRPVRPAPPPQAAPARAPQSPPPQSPPPPPRSAGMPPPGYSQPAPAAPQAPAPRPAPPEPRAPAVEPRFDAPRSAPPPPVAPQSAPQPAPQAAPGDAAQPGPDPKLHNMAQRLESALSRPYTPPPPSADEETVPEDEPRRPAPDVDLYDEDSKQER